jgi:hypothetical protein
MTFCHLTPAAQVLIFRIDKAAMNLKSTPFFPILHFNQPLKPTMDPLTLPSSNTHGTQLLNENNPFLNTLLQHRPHPLTPNNLDHLPNPHHLTT